jgi:hypothetical protein
LRAKRSNPFFLCAASWIASRSLSSGAHSRDPVARNDAARYESAFSRTPRARALLKSFAPGNRGRRESRVRAAPAVSRAKCTQQKRTRAYRFSGEHPAFPAQWFYGLLRALPGEACSFATIAREKPGSRELGASVGRQNHTTSPSASATFVFVTFASTASHRAFVTIASRPSCRVRRAERNH